MPLSILLPQVDVLSLHCPLTPETRGLIGAWELALMRRDAILINTARGGLVDEALLADALRQGALGGAGVDVLSLEPPVEPIAGARYPQSDRDSALRLGQPRSGWSGNWVENIAGFLSGAPMRVVG